MSRVAGSGSSLSSEETAYVRVVRQYNEEILQGGIRPNLAESLSEAATTMNDQVRLWLCSERKGDVLGG